MFHLVADADTVGDAIHRCNEIGLACLAPQWAVGRTRQLIPEDEDFVIRGRSQRRLLALEHASGQPRADSGTPCGVSPKIQTLEFGSVPVLWPNSPIRPDVRQPVVAGGQSHLRHFVSAEIERVEQLPFLVGEQEAIRRRSGPGNESGIDPAFERGSTPSRGGSKNAGRYSPQRGPHGGLDPRVALPGWASRSRSRAPPGQPHGGTAADPSHPTPAGARDRLREGRCGLAQHKARTGSVTAPGPT